MTKSAKPSSPRKLETVQALRGLAALMVAVAHASEEAKYFFHFNPYIDTIPLGKGVDMFFVISGFIIYYSSRSLMGIGTVGVKQFFFNRITRVVPLYYLFTTMMIAVVYFFPGGVKEARFDPYQILSSYTFFPYARYDGRIAPILSLGWTLNYEMFFYTIFGSLMWFGKRIGAAMTIAVLLSLVAIGYILPVTSSTLVKAWTFNILLEFGMGITIALLYEKHGKALSRGFWPATLLIFVSLICLYSFNHQHRPFDLPRAITAGLPAALMVGSAVLLMPEYIENRVPFFLSAAGDSSYSLYLSHRFIQRPIQIIVRKSHLIGATGGWLYMLGAVSAAIICSYAIFKYIEQPILRFFKGRSIPAVNINNKVAS